MTKNIKTKYRGIYIRGDNGKVQVDTSYKKIRLRKQFRDGKPKTIEEAYKRLEEQKRLIDTGKYVTERKTLEYVYKTLDDEKRDTGKKKEQTSFYTDYDFYKRMSKHIDIKREIDSFTKDDLRKFQKGVIRSSWSAGTKNKVISLMKQIYKTAIKYDWVKEDISVVLEKQKVDKKENKVFTDEEQAMMFADAEKTFNSYPNLLGFLSLGIYGGLREGEMLGLQWRDIDFENHDLHVERQWNETVKRFTDPKTEDSKRVIPMFPELQGVMERLYNKVKRKEGFKETDCVLTSWQGRYTGKHLSPNNFSYGLKGVTKRCNIQEETRSHVLRKTCATNLLKRGWRIERVSAFLGHSKPIITYTTYTNKNEYLKNAKNEMWQNVEKKGA